MQWEDTCEGVEIERERAKLNKKQKKEIKEREMANQVVKVKREAIAACMTCPLCNKLLRDATTISECLHTCESPEISLSFFCFLSNFVPFLAHYLQNCLKFLVFLCVLLLFWSGLLLAFPFSYLGFSWFRFFPSLLTCSPNICLNKIIVLLFFFPFSTVSY